MSVNVITKVITILKIKFEKSKMYINQFRGIIIAVMMACSLILYSTSMAALGMWAILHIQTRFLFLSLNEVALHVIHHAGGEQ